MMKKLLLLLIMLLCGCAASTQGHIRFEADEVYYTLGSSGKIYYKDEKKETFYDTNSPSLLRTLIEGAAIKEINK